jgi:hypothetical protein
MHHDDNFLSGQTSDFELVVSILSVAAADSQQRSYH